MNQTISTSSAKETWTAGVHFAKQIRSGDLICLHGDLGAGKTTWVKGLAEGLGLAKNEAVTSPTFSLMHRYSSRIPLYHFDCYRLNSPAELADIGFEEFVQDSTAIVCVEWPEKAGELLPKRGWDISFLHQGGDARLIQVKKR